MSDVEISTSDIFLQESVIFEQGKKYLIKAHSGHGKSSVLNFIYGASTNFSGKINYNAVAINQSIFELRKTEISYVFQDFKLFPSLTVFENIQLKNTLTNHKTSQEIDSLIDQFQLSHKRNSLVGKLSQGQKQRVAIIRALCQPFKFILLDEPFSHLDEKNIKIISEVILKEIEATNAGLIITSLGETSAFDYDKILNL